jgi:hypothetical protein
MSDNKYYVNVAGLAMSDQARPERSCGFIEAQVIRPKLVVRMF